MNKIRIISSLFVVLILSLIVVIRHIDRLSPINIATKTCLITGASSGIGLELSREMVKRGWKVIGIARREDKLRELEHELGTNNFGTNDSNSQTFIPFVCDVANREQVHNVSETIKAMGLKPTLFFLNAGTGELEQKWKVSTDIHQRTFATNYFGAIAWIEEWLASVKQFGGGTFVATSSVAALLATPGSAAYATSKIALVHCFDSFRRQYLNDKIGFITVLPGPTDTEMLKGAGAKSMPFIHKADDEARYIVDQVFAGKKQIGPSLFYSFTLRILNWLPDKIALKLF
ncbi:MAG: SDR family oxidoreductase [bacterium]